ncbi:lysophospholipase catalytic domain-containing protein [Aspergillus novoparasiticus]|uniref:Lysophospholipase n=1 Tax=Aspergillus novoparasiticus TaxID=986946 RepID=A0A5N6ERM0_9EURO|nr:lysophospholipase catalytic domain-containing protein [Aspergillus novoparasiticus]
MHISAIILLASTLLLGACGIPAIELPSVSRHYTPIKTLCPEGTLVRPATGLSTEEMEYRAKRKRVADEALKRWLVKTKDGFDVDRIELPTIGLTTSGGDYRSFLVGAGVIQGLDERDSNETTSGLFQALTYQAGLSGGAWLLSSLAGNNYPTVTQLKNVLWVEGFQNGLLQPGGSDSGAYEEIALDITEKRAAGFEITLTDPYGRFLSYQLFAGPDYGGNLTVSSITEMSSFTSHAVPYPVIVSLGVKTFSDECIPGPNGTIYEFTPFEFGSWDSDVNAFTSLKYLGTSLSNGEPLAADDCTANYDNLGYILGTSSHVFNMVCSETIHDSIP